MPRNQPRRWLERFSASFEAASNKTRHGPGLGAVVQPARNEPQSKAANVNGASGGKRLIGFVVRGVSQRDESVNGFQRVKPLNVAQEPQLNNAD